MHTESEAAKECFERGAKADAHKHSVASKALRQDMERAHRRATQCILEPQEWRTSRKLDLHGLFVRGAGMAVRISRLYTVRTEAWPHGWTDSWHIEVCVGAVACDGHGMPPAILCVMRATGRGSRAVCTATGLSCFYLADT